MSSLLTPAHLLDDAVLKLSIQTEELSLVFVFLLSLGSALPFSPISLVVTNPLVAAQFLPYLCVFEVAGPRSMPEPGCLFFSFQQSLKTAKPTSLQLPLCLSEVRHAMLLAVRCRECSSLLLVPVGSPLNHPKAASDPPPPSLVPWIWHCWVNDWTR